MGSIKILDTGYINSDNSGTQASSANRANSGNVFTIKTVEFVPSLSRNISADEELGTTTASNANRGSLSNLKFNMKCSITKKNSSEMALVPHLYDLVRTNGYKLVWYDYTSEVVEGNSENLIFQTASNPVFGDQLTEGERVQFGISTRFYTLHALFNDIQFLDSPKGTIRFDLKGILIPVKTVI
jgi:hypothetical protein